MNDIERLIHAWRSHVEEHAAARAEYEYLKEYRKSLKAILMARYAESGTKAANAQEVMAYADKEYTDHLKALRIATEKTESLRYRMKIAEVRCEVWRTEQANSRKEQKLYGA